jgi:hypothetical protein
MVEKNSNSLEIILAGAKNEIDFSIFFNNHSFFSKYIFVTSVNA